VLMKIVPNFHCFGAAQQSVGVDISDMKAASEKN